MTPTLWDMHVHLDFMRDMASVAADAATQGLGLFAVTVTPEGYGRARRELAGASNVRVGVGIHPWWAADGRCGKVELTETVTHVRETRYVGEVGLDLSPKHVPEGSLEAQLAAFEAIAGAAAETSGPTGPKVLSIHSVRAGGLALDVLERTNALAACNCIFHWFSGTSDELHRAVKAGCWFSINEMMLRTRRGREYARQLPADRLLLETDLPPGENVPLAAADIVASLERTLEQLGALRGTDLRTIVSENAERLMDEGAWT